MRGFLNLNLISLSPFSSGKEAEGWCSVGAWERCSEATAQEEQEKGEEQKQEEEEEEQNQEEEEGKEEEEEEGRKG